MAQLPRFFVFGTQLAVGNVVDQEWVGAQYNGPKLTRQQLAEMIGKDIRTIGRAISRLQQDNQLKRIGPDKTGYWEVQEQ